MAEYLKNSKPEAEKAAEDAKVRAIVESTLAEIERGGDKAVRALSEKFDGYRPEKFRLTLGEIEALIGELVPKNSDIKLLKNRYNFFAQRDSMLDIEAKHPGNPSGIKIFCPICGMLRPAENSLWCVCAMSVATAVLLGLHLPPARPFKGRPNQRSLRRCILGGA